jgi:hypothetical protein
MTEMTKTTAIILTREVAALIAQLPPSDARLLLGLVWGGLMTPKLVALIARLREELRWLPILEFFAEMNKHFKDELDRQTDNDSRPDF